jgi:hypothetical protein
VPEALALTRRDLEVAPLLVAADRVLQEQRVEMPLQQRERRPQIVRHVGDHFAPERIRSLQLPL